MRIAVAMSGGVDSSLAAVMLKRMGHDVVGLTAKIMLCSEMDGSMPRYDVCCSPENMNDARDIAKRFGFPHVLVSVEDDFSREVIDPFCEEYLRGRTPSPCVYCNARIKFKSLIAMASELGCEKLATGHYARLISPAGGRRYISTGVDKLKDQSYFLFLLGQDILERSLFPLGDYHKSEIRRLAMENNLSVAEKPESQEICFVLDNDYPGYIERRTGRVPPAGDIVNAAGVKIGRHGGIHRYTIGQRRGLGISSEKPLYVIGIDAAGNLITAGSRDELNKNGLFAKEINYMKVTSLHGVTAFIKTRSMQTPFEAYLEETDGGVRAVFKEPQIGITPGQAAVFYDGDGGILGGGWIENGF